MDCYVLAIGRVLAIDYQGIGYWLLPIAYCLSARQEKPAQNPHVVYGGNASHSRSYAVYADYLYVVLSS